MSSRKKRGGRKDSNNKLSTVVLKLVTSEICSIFSKINFTLLQQQGLQRASQVLSGESACQCRRQRFDPWIGKIPWKRKWQPTPVFLPGEVVGQRSLVDYRPWGHKESDMTEWLSRHARLAEFPWETFYKYARLLVNVADKEQQRIYPSNLPQMMLWLDIFI